MIDGGSKGDMMIVISSHDRNGGRYSRMNEVGKGKSCWDEGSLLLLFSEKKSQRRDLELKRIWIGKPFFYEWTR